MTTMSGPRTRSFAYEVLDAKGARSKGTIEASTRTAAASSLQAQGLLPVAIVPAGTGLQREITIPGLGNRTSTKDLAIFARQFATMTTSGLSLLRSLAILEEQQAKPALRKAIGTVRADIEGGLSMSTAMAKHDRVFPALMVAMIRAGEAGGFLDQALDRVAVNFEKDAALRSKIRSALTYPAIVLAFSGLMIAGVMIFIVPIFEKMFANLGGQLPLPTRIIVTISHQIWWIAIVLAVLATVGSKLLRRRLRADYAFRLRVDRLKLKVPVFGPLLTKIAISRFARNLGTLLTVGVPIMQALDVVGGTTGNAVITEAMKDVQQSVREGHTMSAPLSRHPVFPAMVTQMMEVGEETGQISAMLEKVAEFYDQEVDNATEALTSAIEPIMVVLMGGIVGSMVVCLYLPMFTIGQHIQGAN